MKELYALLADCDWYDGVVRRGLVASTRNRNQSIHTDRIVIEPLLPFPNVRLGNHTVSRVDTVTYLPELT